MPDPAPSTARPAKRRRVPSKRSWPGGGCSVAVKCGCEVWLCSLAEQNVRIE